MWRALLVSVGLLSAPVSVSAQKIDFEKLMPKREFESGKSKLLYRILEPAELKKDEKVPLVIFLHGAGERGKDNVAQLKHGVGDFCKNREKYPCFVIAPQCPSGRLWNEIKFSAKESAMTKDPNEQGALVLALIEKLSKDLPIDTKRIYITGLSMGGYGTWDLISRRPELFAAAIPVCGGGDEKQAEKLTKLPIWAFHGDKDTAVPVSRSRNMIEAIKKAGGEPKYTEYAGVGHDSWTKTYADPEVMKWLFEQKRK